MNVLLFHLDGRLPNLAIMRIAAHHRALGDHVELRRAGNATALDAQAFRDVERRFDDKSWDRVYASLIFERTRPLADRVLELYPQAEIGGTGSLRLNRTLADVGIEDGELDYADYPKWRQSIGFAMRGCRLKCDFCVVPRKEGKPRPNGTIASIWRGGEHPREVVLLDNDFFGNVEWPARIDELKAGGFKVCFSQGINARFLDDETAGAIASVDYRNDTMRERRIYTAWDSKRDEKRLFRGLSALVKHGVKPDHIMVYMLIGYAAGENHEDRDHRRRALREFGARPYPMPFVRTPELVGFQRWVIQAYDKRVPWKDWAGSRFSPRRLGNRGSLPLFPEPALCTCAVPKPSPSFSGQIGCVCEKCNLEIYDGES